MAQRGGTVISMVKVGPFKGPLIPAGSADAGLFMEARNLAVHGHYLREGGLRFVNPATPGEYLHLDARGLAAGQGLPPVAANLILLGFAAGKGGLFCEAGLLEQVISANTPPRLAQASLPAFRAGLAAALA